MRAAIVAICLLAGLTLTLGLLPFILHDATTGIKRSLWFASIAELIPLCGLVTVALTFNKEDILGGIVGSVIIALIVVPAAFATIYWYQLQKRFLMWLYKKVANKSK